MALIKTIALESAGGDVADVYSFWKGIHDSVPKPFELMSVSPNLMKIQLEIIQYFMNHESLEFPILSIIRYLTAKSFNHQFCINYNRQLLKSQGMSDEEIGEVEQKPEKAPLLEKEQAMLAFVMKAVSNPDMVDHEDIKVLRDCGWNDKAIFDAVYHASMMVSQSILMRTFKMEID